MLKLSVFILILYVLSECDCKSIRPLNENKKPIWFNETIPSNQFGSSGFGGSWISPTEFTYNSNRDLMKFNIETKATTVLYNRTFSEQWASSTLRITPDGNKVLIRYEPRSIFRHSTVAKFSVKFKDDTNIYKISNGDELQLCSLSPSGNGLIYIKNNTVYYLTDEKIKENSTGKRSSDSGIPGVKYQGIPDWVYEEEVLGSDAAAWFSPEGKYLVYAEFNDTNVKDFTYELYSDGKGEFKYPQEIHLRYPKVGENNPKVNLFVDVLNEPFPSIIPLETPLEFVSEDHILGTVFWINANKVGALWLNRRQNKGVIVSYESINDIWVMSIIKSLNEPNGWIELNTPKCVEDEICYFINNADNWPSLIKLDVRQNTTETLTKNKHVFSYIGSRNGKIYYSATPGPDQSYRRHTYVLENDVEKCLTCGIKTPEGNNCTYATTSFSTDLSYYALTCSGPDVSFTKIYKTDSNDEPYDWQLNNGLRTKLQDYELPQIKIFHVQVGEKFNAPVKMQLPPEIDFENPEKNTEKYPLLVRVYGGPGSVRISESFGIGYNSYQVTTKKIIYVEIDGRGTGQKGAEMMFSVNDKLGTYEMEDQISVTKHLVSTYPFIDKERISIWGWSYGGYATAMTLAKDVDKVFKCGVSVAPVTSWLLYDTIYTERYMGIDAKAKQYNDSDVALPNHIENIGKHDFLLVHGNADDNVHYQQSMILAGALERADILFDQMSYPDEAHGLSGVSLHLYHSLDRFWDKCFKL